MKQSLFDTTGTWYKGNLHMHTTRSDGALSPEDAILQYRMAGYDFVALTDHRKPCKEQHLPAEGELPPFLVLPGVEWDTGNNYPGGEKVFHILGIGMERDDVRPAYTGIQTPPPEEIVKAIREAGGLAFLAHPSWSVMDPEDIHRVKGVCGVEIYNTISGTPWNVRRADSSQYFDIWGASGILPRAIATDDAHQYNGDQCVSFIYVNAKDLTTESIKRSLAMGNFYASQGPKFTEVLLDEENGTIDLTVSKDVRMVLIYNNYSWSRDHVSYPDENGHVTFHRERQETFVRVEAIDDRGRMAWLSPMDLVN